MQWPEIRASQVELRNAIGHRPQLRLPGREIGGGRDRKRVRRLLLPGLPLGLRIVAERDRAEDLARGLSRGGMAMRGGVGTLVSPGV